MKQTIGIVIERLDNLKSDNAQEHKAILDQVLKTNGAVADIQKWRYLITGALVIMNIFIVPIIVAVVVKYIITRI
jgi:hypothetical protein